MPSDIRRLKLPCGTQLLVNAGPGEAAAKILAVELTLRVNLSRASGALQQQKPPPRALSKADATADRWCHRTQLASWWSALSARGVWMDCTGTLWVVWKSANGMPRPGGELLGQLHECCDL